MSALLRTTAIRALTLAAAALGVTACGDAAYRGNWEVVGYHRPNLSMLGDAEAQAWLGSRFELSAKVAAVGADTCRIADARRQTLSVLDIEMTYSLAKGDLGLDEESVDALDLQCSAGGIPWGQQLIKIRGDTLLAPWADIFLKLGRSR